MTNYPNSKKIAEPFHDWIHNKIIKDGMLYLSNNPLPTNSIYVITLNGYNNEEANDFNYLFRLCLKLVYYQPTLISNTAELIPNLITTKPTWNSFKNVRTVSKNEINSETFNKVIEYFKILSNSNKKFSALNEIYKITEIDDVLLELLCLYSFIEGFWHNQKGNSDIIKSLDSMLKQDYAPGNDNKKVREKIKTTIKNLNGKFRNSKLNDMRHILAHGIYKQHEESWSKEQWSTLNKQRNLLIELVIESLVNREK
ncbi:hypothetical protein GSB9_02911 [Flavobacteriaceae bacterium GSB9]|nr:hypothetical protein GSB9_02911 [Flavobacteriaceae bacterium GSB9]